MSFDLVEGFIDSSYSDEEVEEVVENDEQEFDYKTVDDLLFIDKLNQNQKWCAIGVNAPPEENKELWERFCMNEFLKLKVQNELLSFEDEKNLKLGNLTQELIGKNMYIKQINSEYCSEQEYLTTHENPKNYYNYNNYTSEAKDLYPNEWFEGLIKFRGTFNTQSEADEHSEQVATKESVLPVFKAYNGLWYDYNPDATLVEDQKTPNKKYNEMVKGYYENKKLAEKKRKELERKSKLEKKYRKSKNKRTVNRKRNVANAHKFIANGTMTLDGPVETEPIMNVETESIMNVESTVETESIMNVETTVDNVETNK